MGGEEPGEVLAGFPRRGRARALASEDLVAEALERGQGGSRGFSKAIRERRPGGDGRSDLRDEQHPDEPVARCEGRKEEPLEAARFAGREETPKVRDALGIGHLDREAAGEPAEHGALRRDAHPPERGGVVAGRGPRGEDLAYGVVEQERTLRDAQAVPEEPEEPGGQVDRRFERGHRAGELSRKSGRVGGSGRGCGGARSGGSGLGWC
ncbi:MAG: hypothetical protein A2177_14535 [Spirochaetes bacterium RBG_13_68_11]|nr:MAG: hypothetical protein A2177_14535 [Spirochaetes bacterium RBG_13_68_11]